MTQKLDDRNQTMKTCNAVISQPLEEEGIVKTSRLALLKMKNLCLQLMPLQGTPDELAELCY